MSTHSISNQPLAKLLRSQLESTVKSARDIAEKGASAALKHLAVGDAKVPDYLTGERKALRRRLRAHGRALGDAKARDDSQEMQHLVWEVAYEHWHRMLFARFLAENGLLLWEPGAALSLDECEALVQEHDEALNLGAKTKWELGGKLAARMLPQVFKPNSPVFELAFAPEHLRELERLLAALPPEVFKASDSLGWVYQFWQSKRKDEVNALELKIGADELPAVTQLFTEPFMVDFLLHNSIGAWWVTRNPGKSCPVPLTYLRTLEDGTPAAGKFEGWPDRLEDFRLLDPCCGSGHFLVAAFLMMVPMRMEADGLGAMDAVDAVLANNLHGLELDPRCVEIAVFALALAAWRFLDESGHPLGVRTEMPAPKVACCGLKVAAKVEDWMALVPDDAANATYLRQELRLLHGSFGQAPLLGSLLNPARSLKNDLATPNFDTLRELLERALSTERATTPWAQANELQDDSWDLTLTAKGLLDAARLLGRRYHLVVTNVPYLSNRKQTQALRDYCEAYYPDAKNDIANVFLERCLELAEESGGVAQIVMPQNWLFLTSYRAQRASLLKSKEWNLLARLGEGGFDSPQAAGAFIILITLTNRTPALNSSFSGLAADKFRTPADKAEHLKSGEVLPVSQAGQTKNPDSRIAFEESSGLMLLESYADSYAGQLTGDGFRFILDFYELPIPSVGWEYFSTTVDGTVPFGGYSQLILWEEGIGKLARYREDLAKYSYSSGAWKQGWQAWKRWGIRISQMRALPATLHCGGHFDNNCAVIVPKNHQDLTAIWLFCSSTEFNDAVRRIDQKVNVTNSTLAKVPFDLEHWRRLALERFENGVPKPYSNDPTEWLFHGHPLPATDPLQVAVARLVGYRWPAESDAGMELADEARVWIERCDALTEYTDDDGIVCMPSVRGETPAHDRLLELLIAAWETVQPGSWKPAVLDKLLADAECAGKGLDTWLRDSFFEQHSKRFRHRPFIWHVWDGLRDGFAALVNYHRLDTKNLERLIHTYLGDWIRQQEAGVRDSVDGAQQRLAASHDLKRRLELILEGEFDGKVGYDIFVRWKSLSEQPVGWNPDLNDGVRINIRPFVTAEVLRHYKKPRLNISWDKDRGKDVESSPWFKVFKGERINDHHLTIAEKTAARSKS
jgi:hypothetical protein